MKIRWWVLVVVVVCVVSVAVYIFKGNNQKGAPTSVSAKSALSQLNSLKIVSHRQSVTEYRRANFGEAWTDDNAATDGHNGCDTRNDILNRDIIDKIYTSIQSCTRAIASGRLHSPYTGEWINFQRGALTGAAVQIDHIVPLSYSWDSGAAAWDADKRIQFANDPANLVAVDGDSNQDKGDKQPSRWMPKNKGFHCQYAIQFISVLNFYQLALDKKSVPVLRTALATC